MNRQLPELAELVGISTFQQCLMSHVRVCQHAQLPISNCPVPFGVTVLVGSGCGVKKRSILLSFVQTPEGSTQLLVRHPQP